MSLETDVNPSAIKIVIITGDDAFGQKLQSSLEQSGYTVTLVTDGVSGLQTLTDVLPHLVLLDVVLKNKTGYEILAQKMAEPLLAKIPVFLLSTQGTPVNMRLVPQGSVAQFILALHADPQQIVNMVNEKFGRTAPKVITSSMPGSQKKILWIEDDKLIGNILGKKMASSGFDVTHATNGEQALRELQKSKPDAIVIDLLLPGMNGFDILQNIRADQNLKDVPVMILSNLSKPSDIEKAKNLGAQKFLVKAIASLDQIVAEIKSLK